MLILALDTTTRAGSAAIVRDGGIVHEQIGDASLTHGQRLPADLMRVLDRAQVRLADIDLFAVAAGPGSFTGLRVGIATIQGLAVASGRRVVPVSVLDALARAARLRTNAPAVHGEATEHIAPWMDAQRGEVFAAIYHPSSDVVLVAPTSGSPAATLDAWAPYTAGRTLRFIGDGALRYRLEIAARLGTRARIMDDVPPLAGIIGVIATERAGDAVVPHAVVPIYIRRPDAELARARRGGAER
jgi:tRNA threonylcarbamoyladenosine biosynthesis protein TsaB